MLFCDLVDSTALAHEIGAEAMHELLSEFFTRALAQVHHFEGTVNQFLGDGFMAIFGAPLAFEDHAARAALAALAIRSRCDELSRASPLRGASQVQIRIGINSGQVVVGAIGDDLRMDYTAVGDTTNLAARLQSAASAHEILLGEATVAAAGEAIEVTDLGAQVAKGVAAPVRRFCLINARALTSRSAQRRAAMVGREAELTRLKAALNQRAGDQVSVLEIVGEPGVGKSRLILEFAAVAESQATVVHGHCISYGSQVPNVPIADLVRGLIGADNHDSDSQLRALTAAIASKRANDVDYLGALIDIPNAVERVRGVDPATARGRTTAALTSLVTRTAETRPLVLIIEDLHWIDASSMDFLTSIATAAARTQCLIVVTSRPGSELRWPLEVTRLTLAPLIDQDSRKLLEGLTREAALNESQIEQVLTRGEGNPLFIEELVRAVPDGEQHLPDNVMGVISTRLDRLAPDQKHLLSVAAVLGREFSLAMAEAVAGLPATTATALGQIARLGFIESTRTAGRYSFVHALIQEVAYTNMLGPERRQWHRCAAEQLAALALTTEQNCEEVSRHHLLGDTQQAALPFLELAVAKSLRTHALEAADRFFQDAVRLLEEQPETPENIAKRVVLILQQFPAFHFTHRHREYEALMQRYRSIVEATNNRALLGPFYAQLAHRLMIFSRFAEAREIAEIAVRYCTDVGDHPNAAHAEMVLSWMGMYVGDFASGERHGFAALKHTEVVPVPLLITYTHVGIMLNLMSQGRWRDANLHGERARETGVLAQDDGLASFGGAMGAWAAAEGGDYAQAITLGERALKEAPTDYFRNWAYAFMADGLCHTGQVELGMGILEQAHSLAKAANHVGYTAVATSLMEARLQAGRLQAAKELAIEMRTSGRPYIEGISEMTLGEVDLRESHPADALNCFQKAVEIFERIGARHMYARAIFGCGRAFVALGDTSTAQGMLRDALGIFHELGSCSFPEQVVAVLDQL